MTVIPPQGLAFSLVLNLVSWAAKKQSTISRSNREAEYRSLATTAAKIRWFGYLFRALGIPLSSPPLIFVIITPLFN